MNIEKLNKMDACRQLLPEPGAEVVRECITEIRAQRALLQKCFGHLGKEIKRKRLNESAADGTQALSLEIAEHLDGV